MRVALPQNGQDVFEPLQKMIDGMSNGMTLEFPCMGRFRCEKTLTIDKRITVLGNESELYALTSSPYLVGSSMRPGWPTITEQGRADAYNRTRANVRVSVPGVKIDRLRVGGSNPYAGVGDKAFNATWEAQHGFDLQSAHDARLSHCQAHDVWGDFVYVGGVKPSQHVLIDDFFGTRNGRSGMSIVNAVDVMVERWTMAYVRRSMFNLEPGTNTLVSLLTIQNGVGGSHRLGFLSCVGKPTGVVDGVQVFYNEMYGGNLSVNVKGLAVPATQEGGVYTRRSFAVIGNLSTHPEGNGRMAGMWWENVDGIESRLNNLAYGWNRNMHNSWVKGCKNIYVDDNTGENIAGQLIYG